ncbi:hypothetical protein EES42_39020 [Streptomyces sp. ADI95-17]|nr:hypothetical protein EES42_39020 [Streptomyces sp. ADI95-17]
MTESTITSDSVPSSASASMPRSSASLSFPTTTARWASAARLVASENATSDASSPGRRSRCDRRSLACAVRARADFADSIHGRTGEDEAVGATGRGSASTSGAGACSMIVWALVPLMPNDDTAARRGPPVSGHATDSLRSSTAPADQSTCVDGSSTCKVCGSTPCRIAMTILMIPATPAAACV